MAAFDSQFGDNPGGEGPEGATPAASATTVSGPTKAFVPGVGSVLSLGRFAVARAIGQRIPFQMTLSVTNRCNFRCDYCNIPLQQRDEMTTTEWFRAIDELMDGGMSRVSLIGGEPMLRKDIGDIIRYLKAKGAHVSMNSNGWYTEARLDDMKDLDLVCLTLDGPEHVHDAQREKGSYQRVVKSIDLLTGAGVKVVTMSVITPKSIGTLEHVLEIAKAKGITSFFQIEHDAEFDVYRPVGANFTQTDLVELARRLRRLKNEGWPVGNSHRIIDLQEKDGQRLGGSCAHCFAGQYFGYVFSDGSVAPCLATQWQMPREEGRKRGFLKAFQDMPAPQGPGCACVPLHEVNQMLSLDLRVLWNAVELTFTQHNTDIRKY